MSTWWSDQIKGNPKDHGSSDLLRLWEESNIITYVCDISIFRMFAYYSKMKVVVLPQGSLQSKSATLQCTSYQALAIGSNALITPFRLKRADFEN
jgi:hypothetical protein